MINQEKEMSPEVIAQQKEEARQLALTNLGSSQLTDLASAYLVDSSGQYGEAGNSAIEQFKYLPAIKSGEGANLITNSLLGSRQDNKRYSGTVSEYNIISDSAKIIQGSLGQIYIQDILDLIGSKKQVKDDYKDKFISDLASSDFEEVKKLAGNIVGSYMQFLTDTKVSEALNDRTDQIGKGLEEILTEPEIQE